MHALSCVYKSFLAAAYTAGRAWHAAKLGIHAQIKLDFPAVMEWVQGIRSQFNQGTQRRLDSAGVKVVCAEAMFPGERTVSGGDVTVQAPIVVINTGTSSSIPDFPGLAGTLYSPIEISLMCSRFRPDCSWLTVATLLWS